MEEAFMALYRQAEMMRLNTRATDPPVTIYFECARSHIRPFIEQTAALGGRPPGFVDPATVFDFPVCINDQLRKPRLVIEPIHVGEVSETISRKG
jgi:hypothetical protein